MPADVQAVRQLPPLVCFSDEMAVKSATLKRFLLQNLYRHPQVVETTQTAQQVVRDLFAAYMADPAQMPQAHSDRFDQLDSRPAGSARHQARPERVVADYIAGMTDRFAAKEHERLNGRVVFPV
jgi:dGTPase